MKITIRPDLDCIELIRSEFNGMIINFLKSVGIPAKDSENWEATHTVEINENDPALVDVFDMKCYLSDELLAKSQWIFNVTKDGFITSFVISGKVFCCKLSSTGGLKTLSQNLDSLQSLDLNGWKSLTDISSLSGFVNLQSLNLCGCTSLTDISSLSRLINLRRLNLCDCESLTDISSIAGLLNLQTLNLSGCESLTDIGSLTGLLNLQSLNLSFCKSLTDISSLAGLLNLQSLNLSKCESLTEISILSSLINLQSLDLGCCFLIKDISILSSLINVISLDLSYLMKLGDIRILSGLLNLRKVKLRRCDSLTDINILSKLVNLKVLDISGCELLLDINIVSTLVNLQLLDISDLLQLGDISSIAGLLNLQSLNLSGCKSLTDISSIAELLNLQSLDLSGCRSLTDIGSLTGLLNLQSLNLDGCQKLVDINGLSGLLNLRWLNLSHCDWLPDISILSGLVNLQTLILFDSNSLFDISCLSGLVNLQTLNLSVCNWLTDINSFSNFSNLQSFVLFDWVFLTNINSLSGLVNLRKVEFRGCNSLTDIGSLAGLLYLESLNLEGCKRIQNYSSLRKCLSLKELSKTNMHPAESAELLCFLAVQRKDIIFISQNTYSWLRELKLGFDQNHSSSNDLACSLAQGIVLANLDEVGLSFHQTLLNHPNVGISPWKIWFSENLKTFGWNNIQNLAELNQIIDLTSGLIGGLSSCLPSLEGDSVQIAWAKKWIFEIHSLYNNNPNFLKPVAAEWCLALKRLGEDELLREWIEKFSDPSDPFAFDHINKVFSAYALDLNDSESALEYALKINDPKLRDESILNLAQQFIKEGETTKAGEFLFLLTQVESRTQLSYSLAEDAAYLKTDENVHRLLAACGDNPQSLASILDKLRIANPNSEILEIMFEKLGDESRSEIPIATVVEECNSLAEFLIHTKDPSQLVRIRQAIESITKSN